MNNYDFLRVYDINNKLRIGSNYDGGYIIIDNLCNYDVLLSCGIANDDTFEHYFVNKHNKYNNKKISDEELVNYLKLFKTFENEERYNLEIEVSNKSLSSGQMQKIAFIRTLVYGVDILILDESTANLDSDSKKVIYKIIEDLNITIINSTHNHNELLSYDYHIKTDELTTEELN